MDTKKNKKINFLNQTLSVSPIANNRHKKLFKFRQNIQPSVMKVGLWIVTKSQIKTNKINCGFPSLTGMKVRNGQKPKNVLSLFPRIELIGKNVEF